MVQKDQQGLKYIEDATQYFWMNKEVVGMTSKRNYQETQFTVISSFLSPVGICNSTTPRGASDGITKC